MNMKTEEILLRTSLQDCREKYAKLSGKYLELQAENAKLREELEIYLRIDFEKARIAQLLEAEKEKLAAAQAVIKQMREGIKETMDACFNALNGHSENYYHALKNEMARCRKTLSIQCNQDALHEARAEALDRADRIFMQMSLELRDGTLRLAYGAARDVMKNEAAAHRARKEGK